ALGEAAGGEVGERLRQPESNYERQDRRARAEPEVMLANQRQRRALEPDHRADERRYGDEQRELSQVLAQAELDPASAHRLLRACGLAADAVRGDDLRLPLWGRRDFLEQRGDELVLGAEPERGVVAPLKADRRGGVGRQGASADRSGVVGRIQ